MADGNSKRARRSPHAGRPRGSKIRTGNRGGPRTRLDIGQKILLGQGLMSNRPRLGRRPVQNRDSEHSS